MLFVPLVNGADFTQSDCGYLNSSGTYTLNKSVNTTGDCFIINNDDIVLDCDGFNITGDGVGDDQGFYYNGVFDNVTIKNCEISGFDDGVYIRGDDYLIYNNFFYDIENYAILPYDADRWNISNNNFTDIGGYTLNMGLTFRDSFFNNNYLYDGAGSCVIQNTDASSQRNVFDSNTFENNSCAINDFCTDCNYTNNVITYTGGSSTLIISGGSDAYFAYNNVTCSDRGLTCTGGDNNVYEHNIFNVTGGGSVDTGVYTQNGDHETFRYNTFYGNDAEDCLEGQANAGVIANNYTLEYNEFIGCDAGIGVYSPNEDWTVRYNNFTDSIDRGINCWDSDASGWLVEGNRFVNSDDYDIYLNSDGWNISDNFFNSTTKNSIIFLNGANATVEDNEVYSGDGNYAIHVNSGADNAYIDNNHLEESNSGAVMNGIMVESGATNVIINNTNITGFDISLRGSRAVFDNGVLTDGGYAGVRGIYDTDNWTVSNSQISETTILSICGSGDSGGFWYSNTFDSGGSVSMKNCDDIEFYDNFINYTSIAFSDFTGGEIYNNTLVGNNGVNEEFFYLNNLHDGHFYDNTFQGPNTGRGFFIYNDADGNIIENNTWNGSVGGITNCISTYSSYPSSHNIIRNNIFENCSYSIRDSAGETNYTIEDNLFYSGTTSYIELDANSANWTIVGNNFSDSSPTYYIDDNGCTGCVFNDSDSGNIYQDILTNYLANFSDCDSNSYADAGNGRPYNASYIKWNGGTGADWYPYIGLDSDSGSFCSSCSCPGTDTDWQVSMSDNCTINNDCDIGTGVLNFTDGGANDYFKINATINATSPSNGWSYVNSIVYVIGNNVLNLR